MRVFLFTRDGPRHLHLASSLRLAGCKVTLAAERDGGLPQLRKLPTRPLNLIRKYGELVTEAEQKIFGRQELENDHIAVDFASLNPLDKSALSCLLDANLVIVFGTSLIKGRLFEILRRKNALNIHMGLAPYYRGSACNFWAMFDGRPNYVGATVHLLSSSLDAGPVLFHSRPRFRGQGVFEFTMEAALAVQQDLVKAVENGRLAVSRPVPQDEALLLRKSLRSQFTEQVAREFLSRSSAEMFPRGFAERDTLAPNLQLL